MEDPATTKVGASPAAIAAAKRRERLAASAARRMQIVSGQAVKTEEESEVSSSSSNAEKEKEERVESVPVISTKSVKENTDEKEDEVVVVEDDGELVSEIPESDSASSDAPRTTDAEASSTPTTTPTPTTTTPTTQQPDVIPAPKPAKWEQKWARDVTIAERRELPEEVKKRLDTTSELFQEAPKAKAALSHEKFARTADIKVGGGAEGATTTTTGTSTASVVRRVGSRVSPIDWPSAFASLTSVLLAAALASGRLTLETVWFPLDSLILLLLGVHVLLINSFLAIGIKQPRSKAAVPGSAAGGVLSMMTMASLALPPRVMTLVNRTMRFTSVLKSSVDDAFLFVFVFGITTALTFGGTTAA